MIRFKYHGRSVKPIKILTVFRGQLLIILERVKSVRHIMWSMGFAREMHLHFIRWPILLQRTFEELLSHDQYIWVAGPTRKLDGT